MNILINAFGDNCFSLTNASSGLSASGPETIVDSETGKIIIVQGSNATLQAVGFPIIGEAVEYTWYLNINGTPIAGNASDPTYLFGTYS